MAPNSMSDTVVGPATVNGNMTGKPVVGASDPVIGSREMFALIRDLVRPYTRWLIIVFVAMLMETAMSLASPWPLKVVIDSVLGAHPMPDWMRGLSPGDSKMGLAFLAGVGVVLIALIGALSAYIDNYYTESVGQWVANDLRIRIYDHLQRLSLAYFDRQQTGNLLSTITSDVSTIQSFASRAGQYILIVRRRYIVSDGPQCLRHALLHHVFAHAETRRDVLLRKLVNLFQYEYRPCRRRQRGNYPEHPLKILATRQDPLRRTGLVVRREIGGLGHRLDRHNFLATMFVCHKTFDDLIEISLRLFYPADRGEGR
jgi:hypothetical protein